MIGSLECVPDRLAELVTKEVSIPVVGMGSGPYTDGQALNIYDILGLFDRFTPRLVKKYANLSEDILRALKQFKEAVDLGKFPDPDHSYPINEEVLNQLKKK